MWLLHTKEHRLKAFMEGSVPTYAILSHTWTEDEITFIDIQDLTAAKSRSGWQKIARCCQQASNDGFTWVWVDTCCIDKRSSAELSEAINSMWRYYTDAKECYAYLADVPHPRHLISSDHSLATDSSVNVKDPSDKWALTLAASKWFTRGWTLQELLAPSMLLFLAQDWSAIGRKAELIETLQHITGIESRYLLGSPLKSASIACRMSWASRRRTTRTEDIAYCLLGIFDINMPLLYGEGERAFRRLQLELVQNYTDQSIFAWKCGSMSEKGCRGRQALGEEHGHQLEGILAQSPSCFKDSGSIYTYGSSPAWPMTPFTVTNAGIRLYGLLGPCPLLSTPSSYRYIDQDLRFMKLACSRAAEDSQVLEIGICLRVVGRMAEADSGKNAVNHALRAFPDYLHCKPAMVHGRKTIYLQY